MTTSHPTATIAMRSSTLAEEALRLIEAEAEILLERRKIEPIHRAFRPMVMEGAFDISELAIVTALQAVDHGKPIVVLPITVAARFQHKCLVQNREHGNIRPGDLPGKKVAVRAYSQTTGFWVRTILEMEHGVTSDSICWITQEPPHVAEVAEPPNVLRDPDGAGPAELLESGQVDAAIFGNDLPDAPWVRPVVDDPDARARASFEHSHVAPINHVLAVSSAFAARHSEAIATLSRAFATSRARVLSDEQRRLHPMGSEEMRHSVDVLLQHAAAQGLTRRQITFDELFAGATALVTDPDDVSIA